MLFMTPYVQLFATVDHNIAENDQAHFQRAHFARHFWLWPPCVPDAALYFCPEVSSSIFFLFFFPRLISAVTDWISTILLHMVWP